MIRSNKLLLIIFILSLLLNLSDGILTIYGIKAGLVTEINPIMDYLIRVNPMLFIIVKVFTLIILIYYIWVNRHRNKVIAISLALMIFLTFVLINAWNINIIHNVRSLV